MKAKVGFFCLTAIFLLEGCSQKEEIQQVDDSDILYSETRKLVREYTDSINLAVDSLAAKSAFSNFNAKLDSLNFSVAPNTDLLLTEGENDTLYYEIMGVKVLYTDKLKKLGEPEPTDEETEITEEE